MTVRAFKEKQLQDLRRKLKEANYTFRIYSLKLTSIQNDIADLETRIEELNAEVANVQLETGVGR